MRGSFILDDYQGDLRQSVDPATHLFYGCCNEACPHPGFPTWLGCDLTDCCPICGELAHYRNDRFGQWTAGDEAWFQAIHRPKAGRQNRAA